MTDFFLSYADADSAWAEWLGFVLEEEGVQRAWTVAQAVAIGVLEFEYLYGFGDDWWHRIVIEPASRSRVPGAAPLCLAEEGAWPAGGCRRASGLCAVSCGR